MEKDIEAVAIATIMESIASLDQDRKIAVLNFIIQRIGGIPIELNPQAQIPMNSGATEINNDDIKTFLKTKNPQNKYQQVAVLAYYLIKKSGENGVNKDMIEEANKNAGGRTIDDISGTLNDAKAKYGYLGAGGNGKKNLLAFGEDIVNALPDQEKVKEISKKSKPKRRKTRASKKIVKKQR